MQNVNASWAKVSHAAMRCMSEPTHFQCAWAWGRAILNWNHADQAPKTCNITRGHGISCGSKINEGCRQHSLDEGHRFQDTQP